MISSIAWVPAGVADPRPTKYELSAAEQELIAMMEGQSLEEAIKRLQEKAAAADAADTDAGEEANKEKRNSKDQSKSSIEHDLPADLRMDEYSSDEDDDDADEGGGAVAGTALGNLLVDHHNIAGADLPGGMSDDSEADSNREEVGGEYDDEEEEADDDDDGDDEDEDDLADVPDTREFMPLDVEGLTAMGISGSSAPDGGGPDYMDDDEGDIDGGSEAEDVNLNPDDAIVVVAKTDEDFATLEVHVYEQTRGNLYVHHDIPLPAFPLCLAHGDVGPSGNAGNFCAVGTFNPGIEVWNLDVLNALEPSCVLGGEDTSMADELMRHNMLSDMGQPIGGGGANKSKKKKKKAKNGPQLKPGSHTDAVMSLSWNSIHRQVIASGSADCTVKLWDITKADTTAGTFSHHKDKVQSVLWHPQEGTLLATGSYDRTVALIDARGTSKDARKVKITADCESMSWDPMRTHCLTVATEDGRLTCWDVRKFLTNDPLWSFVANEYGVSDLSYNRHVPGMLATCSPDKTVALWDAHGSADVNATATASPISCGSKDMGVGKLYAVDFYPSSPWLLGCAGGGKELALWDMSQEVDIQKRFAGRASSTTNAIIHDTPSNGDNAKPPTASENIPTFESKKKKIRIRKKKAHKKR